MSNSVEIIYKETDRICNEKKIRLLCNEIFDILSIDNWELSIVICNDLFIKNLNKEYRGIDEPTDVLSFPQIDNTLPVLNNEILYAGDIVISIDTLEKNAEKFCVEINEEFRRIILHGILHIDGYTHSDNNPDQKMLVFQEEIMKKLTGVEIL
jgi:probable rRNA maturation factor